MRDADRITFFLFFIASAIAFENHSGKIRDRFSGKKRIAVLLRKTDLVFYFKNGSRWKNRSREWRSVMGVPEPTIQISLTFCNRIAIFSEKTDLIFHKKNGSRFKKILSR